MKKPIILHYHLFKNAGTTIDWILEKNFGKNAIRMDADIPRGILPNKTVLQFIEKNPNVNSVSSHRLRLPVPENTKFFFLPMIFIRHPIDRIFSIYSYNKRRKDVRTIPEENAKKMNVSEYITSNLIHKKNHAMKNFQVLVLTKSKNDEKICKEDLEIAKKRLAKLFIFGVVDRLDESLVLAEERLRPFFKKIDLSYVTKNVSVDRSMSLEERLKEDHKSIGEILMNELKEKNSQDQSLYDFSKIILNEKINGIENFDEKMKNFKSRCHSLKNKVLSITGNFKNRRIWYSEEQSLLYYYNRKKDKKEKILLIKE